jgi:hypothetical protein
MVKCQQWLVLLVFATAFHGNNVAWAASGQLRVLVVHATRQDTQLPLLTDHHLPRILNTRLSQTVDYYAEYIDAPRIPTLQHERAFRDYLRAKYRNHRFDLVIAMQDVAWDFVRKYRSVLFPRTPIVFSSRNRNVPRPVNSTGVVSEINLRATLDFALTLQPETKQVFVVTGASSRDRVFENLARAPLPISQAFRERNSTGGSQPCRKRRSSTTCCSTRTEQEKTRIRSTFSLVSQRSQTGRRTRGPMPPSTTAWLEGGWRIRRLSLKGWPGRRSAF